MPKIIAAAKMRNRTVYRTKAIFIATPAVRWARLEAYLAPRVSPILDNLSTCREMGQPLSVRWSSLWDSSTLLKTYTHTCTHLAAHAHAHAHTYTRTHARTHTCTHTRMHTHTHTHTHLPIVARAHMKSNKFLSWAIKISINDSTLASVCYTVIYMVRVGLGLV